VCVTSGHRPKGCVRLRFTVDLRGCHRPARGAGIGGVCLAHYWWDNESGIGQRGRLAEGFAGSAACRAPGWSRPAGMTRKPRAWCSGSMFTWRRCSPDGSSSRPLISTPNSWTGWSRSPTVVSMPALGLSRPTRWAADRAAMAVLPPLAPTVGTTIMTRLGRDCYVSVGGNATRCIRLRLGGDAVAGRPFAARDA
jgi:hypothetical protein